MKRIFYIFSGIILSYTILTACNQVFVEQAVLQAGVSASIEEPECGELPTRSLDGDLAFSFVDGDFISVFASGDATYMNYALEPDPANNKKAGFKSKNYKMDDNTYYSVYPTQNATKGPSAIPVSFEGQNQSEDASTAHLAEYDFSRAEAVISQNTGVFSFKHKVSWLKMTIHSTDAATITKVTVSATDGVAKAGTLDIVNDTVITSKTADDVIVLLLNGGNGINVAANGTLTAYVTIPADTYTGLKLLAEDTDGHKYVKEYEGETVRQKGKYYTPSLYRTDIPEDTPFTSLTCEGYYSATDTDTPVEVKVYDDDEDQMSYGTGSDYRTFKLANLAANSYAIFTIASSTLTVGETYTVSSDINGTKTEASCKVVKMTDDCVWLEDKTNNYGYIFAIE